MKPIRLSLLLAVTGCTGLLPSSPTPREVCGEVDRACMEIQEVEAECSAADSQYKAWKAVAIASSGLAGATGAGGVLSSAIADEPAADVGLAAASSAFAVMATVGEYLSGDYGEDAVECLERLERLRDARERGGP